ncbi:hypothetical protein EKO04_009125 [Ascochyta lentis]|uniref:Uncharacterized protein n=1 Tax=Ascochyta lentis TaxID=205686 RepID=A0A8H7IXC0_9PLEO|nr:hypothetical protein EKO04_009125 [Ascochyta lentis]
MSDHWTNHSTHEPDSNHGDTWSEPNYRRLSPFPPQNNSKLCRTASQRHLFVSSEPQHSRSSIEMQCLGYLRTLPQFQHWNELYRGFSRMQHDLELLRVGVPLRELMAREPVSSEKCLGRIEESDASRRATFQRSLHNEPLRRRGAQPQRTASTVPTAREHLHEKANTQSRGAYSIFKDYMHIIHAIPTPPAQDIPISPRTIPAEQQKIHIHVNRRDPNTPPPSDITTSSPRQNSQFADHQHAKDLVTEILRRANHLHPAPPTVQSSKGVSTTTSPHYESPRDDAMHRVPSASESSTGENDDESRYQCAGQDPRVLLERLRCDMLDVEELAGRYRERYEAARAVVEEGDVGVGVGGVGKGKGKEAVREV